MFANTAKSMSTENRLKNLVDFNRQKVWFAPKGNKAEDKTMVIREPANLRTIFGGNCDNEILSGGIAFSMTPAALALTPQCQRGFCKNRQLGLNIVDLDAYSRAFNSMFCFDHVYSNIHKIPCMPLYDFCNVFPTLSHAWMFLVLQSLGLPQEYRFLIMWLYTDICAYSLGAGDGSFLFRVLGGVKTGCPLCSILFLLGINPIVDLFLLLTDGPKVAVTRICADDIGSALSELKWFKRQAAIFKLAAKAAGLHLKESKCVLIVSGCELTDDIVHGIRRWLRRHAPSSENMRIESSGKYLGWALGRDGHVQSFKGPIDKYRDRVLEVVAGNAPATQAILRYNQRAVPVLSFVSQFAPPPPSFDLPALEQTAIHKNPETPS